MTDKRSRRNTRQRQVVLEELKNLGSHPTAAELYEIARRRLPKISLGTVYSNLELLAQLGVIRKLQTSGSVARFDGDRGRHYHVCCVRCGRVDDAQGLPTDPLEHEIKSLGFRVLVHAAQAGRLGSAGEFGWGGYASTSFFIDPREHLIGLLLTQLAPSRYYPIRDEFKVLVYQALVD